MAKAKRSVFDVQTSLSREEASRRAKDLLQKEGFKEKEKNGERIFQNGIGFLTAAKFIRVLTSENGVVRIEGWIKMGGEKNLEGVAGIIPKKEVKGVIERLMRELSR